MRTFISAVAGLALLTGVATQRAAADVQTPQPQRTITLTVGQGGDLTLVLPSEADTVTHAGPTRTIEVSAGQGGSISVELPGPGIETVAATKTPAQVPSGAQLTALPTN
jgi:hypothetical protein